MILPLETASDMSLPLDQILQGDCRAILPRLPAESVDLIFADPPYNLQLRGELYRPDRSRVDAVDDTWDRFESFEEYDQFTREWLSRCRRLLKPGGALWVIGSYHNIYRVGAILMDLGYWLLNDVVWVKDNPMPNFRGVRFTNAHETLLWAKRSRDQQRYTFHYKAMKAMHGGKQMRSDWYLPLCTGDERLRVNGSKLHSTQKPAALIERIVRATSSRGEVVLDPFVGSGTTAAVAKRLGRRYIGIDSDEDYVAAARQRVASVETAPPDDLERLAEQKPPARTPFRELLDHGLLRPGERLRLGRKGTIEAVVEPDGRLRLGEQVGSIHRIGSLASGTSACNGWEHWYYLDAASDQYHAIDRLRQQLRAGARKGQDDE